MSRSLPEYHARWQQTMQQLNLSEIAEDPELTNESCVILGVKTNLLMVMCGFSS